MKRIEKDSLGTLKLPQDVYYGIQTARALYNFPVSGIHAHPVFINAYTIIKKSAALTNMELKLLDRRKGKAIVEAASEILSGEFIDQFVVDVFQAGAGTSFNMNVNEVIANRALEILGYPKGEYDYLNPNDHVNMSQSTNDTFPSASHIAVATFSGKLIAVLHNLADSFLEKEKEFLHIPKSGRTHLMDAMPLTLGAEFAAYASAIERSIERISQRRNDLFELAIGGTATGTGANTHPDYMKKVIAYISELCDEEYIPAHNSFEALQSRSQLSAFSSSLKELALELIRIANDLRLLGSGPTTGLAEIEFPPVQPGSSIMPGKVNPVMAECLDMICFQVVGNDMVVALAAQAGQIDLNIMTPIIVYNILQSIEIFTNYLPVFCLRCIKGIKANEDVCRFHIEMNPSLATLLSPKIGYLAASELAKESIKQRVSVPELAVHKGILTPEEASELFDPMIYTHNKGKQK
ncbi:MAG: aspartate ammonia-lyase [Spirochaetota bacterium]|nr:aspartate ammonia-lyase [Spirochaetota bacterium]